MDVLLDTNVLLWFLKDDDRLSLAAREIYLDDSNTLFISIASIWEIFIKLGLGKLWLGSADPLVFLKHHLEQNAISILGITMEHTAAIPTLPNIHRDPFDRLIIAQALHEGLAVISGDRRFGEYGVRNLF